MSMVKEGPVVYKVILQSTQDDRVFESECITVENKRIFQNIKNLITAQKALDKYNRTNNKQR